MWWCGFLKWADIYVKRSFVFLLPGVGEGSRDTVSAKHSYLIS